MPYKLTTILVALFAIAILLLTGAPQASALHDISGTWDAEYALTCDAVFDQNGTDLTADIDCRGGGAGTLAGTVDSGAGTFTLSGMAGLISISIQGTTDDDDTLSGTFSAQPLTDTGGFEAVRDGAATGEGLSGAWTVTLIDVFSGGCTLRLDQQEHALSGVLACDAFSDVALAGTYDDTLLTLVGELRPEIPIMIEGTVSEDGGSIEGTWRVGPPGTVELSGRFSGTLRGGPPPAHDHEEAMDTPTPTPEEPSVLPSTGTSSGHEDARVIVIALLAALGAFAVVGGALVNRRRA